MVSSSTTDGNVDEKAVMSVKADSMHSPEQAMSLKEISKIQRRIDMRIMTWVCLTYLVMRTDANNVSNAAIMNVEQGHGIKEQLRLSPNQWNWVIACYFYPYASLEPLSTLLMKKTSPSLWIGRIMVTWGVIACSMAAVQTYGSLITVRVLLGIAEAGFYPCIIYYLAFWFPPEDLAFRLAFFSAFSQLSSLIGGFIAFAISFADGHLAGWRWLFIIEGIPAILMGFATFYILPDYPQTAKFLTQYEKAAILNRLSHNAPSQESKTWDLSQLVRLVRNPTFWSFSLIWFCHGVGGAGLQYVLPTVIYQLGFTSSALSNALSVLPSFAAFVAVNMFGWLVQQHSWNPFWVTIGLEILNIASYIILLTITAPTVRYLCLLVSTATAPAILPVLWTSRLKAVSGTTAAAIAIGFTNALCQSSGIIGPTVFSTIYGPTYHVSFMVCIGLLACTIFAIGISGLLMGELWRTEHYRHLAHILVAAFLTFSCVFWSRTVPLRRPRPMRTFLMYALSLTELR
ncbi:hypothetical protein Hypma_009339 [Hypsizygus marmoreus]|uniref:Major facilitator superfamily (MFS) profile domain-containing protein n=1 Tax=Hypsizygus marmoreus TaxID=39966 RepID=A0A369JW67_HYPMA|nr:hypothetical protein Hypma_009339 [Hypsizygus marmoreus]